jgi:uncharacterized protein YaaQ
MKMMIIIVNDSDADTVTRELTSADFRVTRIASTGGFLRSGVVTLFSGVDDDRVEAGLQVIRGALGISEPDTARATLFVVPVQRFEKI